jgi:DNA anti-recombination protein RmuC
MAEQASLVQEGVERLSDAFQSLDHEFQRVQKQLSTRRKSIEKTISTTRKSVEKRTRTELSRFQSEVKKHPLLKRADSLVNEATNQLESGASSLLRLLQVPSRSDIARIDKRLSALSRRVKEIEKARKTNGASRTV